jgi:hypothetical protein
MAKLAGPVAEEPLRSGASQGAALAAVGLVGVASAAGMVLSAATVATGDAADAGRLWTAVAGVVLGAVGVVAAARLARRVIRWGDEGLTLRFRYHVLRSRLAGAEVRDERTMARYEREAESLYARLIAAGMVDDAKALTEAVVLLRRRGAADGWTAGEPPEGAGR